MIVKFFNQGKGDGRAIIDYLLSEDKHKTYKPEIVRGMEFLTREIIANNKNRHKYITGVISFAEGEFISEAQQQALMIEFEQTFCPFDDPARVNFLWVRHMDKGRLEIHFASPRIDLKTGKAFNMHPPGKQNELFYNCFVSCKNYEYGFEQVDKKYISKENYNKKLEIVNNMCLKRIEYIKKNYNNKKYSVKRKNYAGRATNNINKSSKPTDSNTSFRQQIISTRVAIKSSPTISNPVSQGQHSTNEQLSKIIRQNTIARRSRQEGRDRLDDVKPVESRQQGLEASGVTLADIDSELGELYLRRVTAKDKSTIDERIARLLAQRERLLQQLELDRIARLNTNRPKF